MNNWMDSALNDRHMTHDEIAVNICHELDMDPFDKLRGQSIYKWFIPFVGAFMEVVEEERKNENS